MTGWVSAAEALRLVKIFSVKNPDDTLVKLALQGVSTRASEWRRDDQVVWLMDGDTLRWAGEAADDEASAKVASVRNLGTGFWEAMRKAPEIVDCNIGHFSYSTWGLYSREGDCLVEPDQRVFWTAMGVEFVRAELVAALKPQKRRPASDDEVSEWFNPQRQASWNRQTKPTEKWIRDKFKEDNDGSNLFIKDLQVAAVQDAFAHLRTAPRGAPKSSANRDTGPN